MSSILKWVCPDCKRTFGRRGQGHTCEPGLSIEDYFKNAPDRERPIFDLVAEHLESLGPVVVEPVSIGVMFKNGPRFAELRTMKKWVAVTFLHPVKLESTRFSRKVISAGSPGSKWYHVVNVADVSEIDDELLDWLTEAYFATETLGD